MTFLQNRGIVRYVSAADSQQERSVFYIGKKRGKERKTKEIWSKKRSLNDTENYSQNTSLTNSFQHKTTINLFYAVPDVLRVLF